MFIKTYNYLKLKTLPSSVLNKCRVLLERNTKYRRITSQFGSTFRNSKWTDYSLNNLTPLNDTVIFNPFLKNINYIFLVLFFSVLLFIYYPSFFLNYNVEILSVVNIFFSFFYIIFDYTYILVAIFLNVILTFTALYPFYNLTSLLLNNNIISKSFNFNTTTILNNNLNQIEEKEISNIYNSLLDTGKVQNTISSSNFLFENSFYRVFLNGIDLRKPTFSDDHVLLKLNLIPLKKKTNLTSLSSISSKSNNKYLPINTTKNDRRNLANYFYINNLDYKKINFLSKTNELVNFNFNITEQLSIINSLRWSYRYSNLHRRTMYNSHKLTESKKLISSGFFDINLTNENLWFSDKYARSLDSKKPRKSLDSKELLVSNWKILYNTTFFNSTNINSISNPLLSNNYNNLLRLSSYESSFHFFLKRLHNFNNLFTNKVSSLPILYNEVNEKFKDDLSGIKFIYNLSLNNKLVNPSNTHKDITNSTLTYTKLHNNFVRNDLVLLQTPAYFLTKKRVDIIYNLTKYSPTTNLNLKYYLRLQKNFSTKLLFKKSFKLKQFKKQIKI